MRRDGIWHPHLLSVVAAAGHGDLIAIVDAGMPVPIDRVVIDLIWARNEPGFVPVLKAVLAECVVESVLIASEMVDAPDVEAMIAHLPAARVSHEELKLSLARCRAVVRTGESTPYRNIILGCGVAF